LTIFAATVRTVSGAFVEVVGWRRGSSPIFSDEQMERLRWYPDIGREELIWFFTLARKDLGFIDNLGRGGGRGPAARMGLAVFPGVLAQYGHRAQTRSDHLKLVPEYLEWQPVPTGRGGRNTPERNHAPDA
jgi:hypothetical protein